MKSYIADYIYTVNADPIKNGVVTVDDYGKIVSVKSQPDSTDRNLEHLSGIICPGFVNAHCHLELSHLKGKVRVSEGLINFIKKVQGIRNISEEEMLEAAIAADQEMYDNGIVAVGDISNSNLTVPIKQKSKIYYHTFIEVFGFIPERAQAVFDNALTLAEQFRPLSCSVVPHAPYSVSKELFRLIKRLSDTEPNLISMHNQESEEENKFYRYKLGEFLDLYDHFGIDISAFKPQARNSIQSVLPLLTTNQRILLVHNTCTNLKDIYFIKRFDRDVTWCFCPNANLYIEKRLPKINLFLDQGFDITLGTDSLASNYKLNILSEMQAIQQNFPLVSFNQLLQWGTINGARFLGRENELGTIEPGKTPGLNLITGLEGLRITNETKVRRLV